MCDPLRSEHAKILNVEDPQPEPEDPVTAPTPPEDPETDPQPSPETPTLPEQPTPDATTKQTDGGGKSDGKGDAVDPSAGVDDNKHVIFKVAGMILLGWFCLHRW